MQRSPRAVAVPLSPRLWTQHGVVEAFNRTGRRVVTFLGFGELGYQEESELFRIVHRELTNYSPNETVVNTGTLITLGFRHGIADVYRVAKAMGFTTTGVHPSVSLTSRKMHALSPCVDDVFFVIDETWGGLLHETTIPSPTLSTLIAVSHEVVVIGGGKYTADEMRAFVLHKTPLRFHAMDMHHATSRTWAQRHDVDLGDPRGAAYHAWGSR